MYREFFLNDEISQLKNIKLHVVPDIAEEINRLPDEGVKSFVAFVPRGSVPVRQTCKQPLPGMPENNLLRIIGTDGKSKFHIFYKYLLFFSEVDGRNPYGPPSISYKPLHLPQLDIDKTNPLLFIESKDNQSLKLQKNNPFFSWQP